MNPDSIQTIRDRCLISWRHNERMKSLMPTGPATSLRSNFARCAIDLSLEHHASLIQVVESGRYGTGGALLRPILEAATAGYWFVYAATCSEIQALPNTSIDNPKADIPGLADMIKSLIPTFPNIQTMSDGLKSGGTAKWLHKYTHGGMPQLNRRINGRWTEGEVILTLIRGDLFSVLAGCLETVINPNADLVKYGFCYRDELGFELQTKFATAPIPQQPHGLPEAPLLNDGCGPPF